MTGSQSIPDGRWVTIVHPGIWQWIQRSQRILDELILRYGGIKGERYWRRWLAAEERKLD